MAQSINDNQTGIEIDPVYHRSISGSLLKQLPISFSHRICEFLHIIRCLTNFPTIALSGTKNSFRVVHTIHTLSTHAKDLVIFADFSHRIWGYFCCLQ